MSNFKFLRGYKTGTLNVMDDQVRSTASFNNLFDNQNQQQEPSLSEMARILYNPITREDVVRDQEPISLFNPVRITVKPTFWVRVKIFGTKIKLALIETWEKERIGSIWVGLLGIVITLISIAKLFWT
jgi:hypothetical protein